MSELKPMQKQHSDNNNELNIQQQRVQYIDEEKKRHHERGTRNKDLKNTYRKQSTAQESR